MTATQLQSGRPCKITQQGQWMLRCTTHRVRQLSAESITTDLQTSCGLHERGPLWLLRYAEFKS